MKATVYSLEGKVLKQIDVPEFFKSPGRDDLVKRAVLSEETKEKQPKGNFKFAGLETSARYRGRKEDFGTVKNKGIPHLPHEVLPKGQIGKVKRVPHAVKGRRAHPPEPQKMVEFL
jgi:large subunit ribosomal protein L4e